MSTASVQSWSQELIDHGPEQWSSALQEKLQDTVRLSIINGFWEIVEQFVDASRVPAWRPHLADPRIVNFFLDECVWKRVDGHDQSVPVVQDEDGVREPTSMLDANAKGKLAIRLAANCCMVDGKLGHDLQTSCVTTDHLDRLKDLLEFEELATVAIGLLTNIINQDEPVLDVVDLVTRSYHLIIARHIYEATLEVSDPMMEYALDLLGIIAEEDIAASTLHNERTTARVFTYLVCALLDTTYHDDGHIKLAPNSEYFEQILGLCLKIGLKPGVAERYMSERRQYIPRQTVDGGPLFEFVHLYDRLLSSHDDWSNTSESSGSHHIEASQMILVKLVDCIQEQDLETYYQDFLDLDFIRVKSESDPTIRSTVKARFVGMLLLLGNIVRTDALAARAAQDWPFDFVKRCLLSTELPRATEVRLPACDFVANLCVPTANKPIITGSGIIQALFYHSTSVLVEPALPVHMVKKLVANAPDWAVKILDGSDAEEVNLPCWQDILLKLPDQRKYQAKLTGQPSEEETVLPPPISQVSDQRLTTDIASILVALLRGLFQESTPDARKSARMSKAITEDGIWALVNTFLPSRETRIMGDPLFALALIAQQDSSHANVMLDAFGTKGLPTLKKAIIPAAKADPSSLERKVGENAVLLVALLKRAATAKPEYTVILEELWHAAEELGLRLAVVEDMQNISLQD